MTFVDGNYSGAFLNVCSSAFSTVLLYTRTMAEQRRRGQTYLARGTLAICVGTYSATSRDSLVTFFRLIAAKLRNSRQ